MTHSFNRLALILLAGSALVAIPALAQPVEPQATGPVAASPAGAAVSEAEKAPMLTFAPPGVDAFARARSHHRAAAAAPAKASTYKVKKGDTLAEVADKLGTDVTTLAKLNGLKKPYRLSPGQTIKGPRAAGGEAAEAPAKGGAKSKAKPETYTVGAGDTLYSIARRFGVSVDDLKAANGLGRSNAIAKGRKLKLPGAGGAEEAREEPTPRRGRAPEPEPAAVRGAPGRVVEIESPGKSVRVKKGESLERVARRMGVDVDDLIRLNHLKKPYHVKAGQTLRGPGGTAKGYVVARGDTLASIAERFDVTVAQLRAANGLSKRAGVAPGRKLRLPAGYRDRGGREEARPTYETPPGRILPPTRSEGERLPSQPQPYSGPGPTQNLPQAAPSVSDAQIMQLGRGLFAWPIRGDIISGFGDKGTSQRNDGVNIRANAGDPVRAAAAGDVVYAGDQVPGFGNLVLIQHADGWVTAYGNLGKVGVRMQQKVTQGQPIGEAGSTGGVSEPQLHFEVRYRPNPGDRARPIDPMLVLPK